MRPSQRAGRGHEALSDSQEEPAGVGKPSWRAGGVGRPTLRDESCQEALLEGRVGYIGPTGGLAVVVRPFWRAGGSGGPGDREALLEGERLFRRSGSGWKALLVGWQWSEGPASCPEGVVKPTLRTKSDREALLEGMEGSENPFGGPGRSGGLAGGREAIADIRGWSGGRSKGKGGVGRPL